MSRNYLTGLNLNQNELLNARIQNLANAPASPVVGQIYYDTGLNKLRQWNGTAWLTYVTSDGGGQFITSVGTNLTVTNGNLTLDADVVDVDATQTLSNKTLGSNVDLSANLDASNNKIVNLATPVDNGDAVNKSYVDGALTALTTDDIEEGINNLYFTDNRAKDAAGSLLENASTSNITFSYNPTTHAITVTAENGVADSTTDNLVEGATNLYFTAARALAATAAAYDAAGSASQAETNAAGYTDTAVGNALTAAQGYVTTHDALTSGVHGVTGNVVGTSDTQTLTNKVIGASSALGANLDADGYTITGLPTPTGSSDAANKQYVDDAVAGLTWKASVNLLAASNVALTGSTGSLVIDGHAALDGSHNGYRILLTAQSTSADNGIYDYTDAGSGYTLTRSADSDAFGELIGATVFVSEGTTYGTSSWVQTNHYLTSFAGQEWVQFNGAAQITAGDGLTKSGNVLNVVGTADRISVTGDSVDIASTYAGQASIDTVGTITSGTWNGTTIAVADGGTGATTAAGARENLGATTKYTVANPSLTPSSGSVTWTVTHNLAIREVLVQVYDLSTYEQVEVDVVRNTNSVALSWVASATVAADSYKVVVIG